MDELVGVNRSITQAKQNPDKAEVMGVGRSCDLEGWDICHPWGSG